MSTPMAVGNKAFWDEFEGAIHDHYVRQMRAYLTNHGWFLDSDGIHWSKRTERSFISAELSEAYDIEHKLSEA